MQVRNYLRDLAEFLVCRQSTVVEGFVGLRANLDSKAPLIFVVPSLSLLHNVLRQQSSKFQFLLNSYLLLWWSKLLFLPVVTASRNMAILVSR